MSKFSKIISMELGKGQMNLDRDYLVNSKEFFRECLPSKSGDLLDKVVFVVLKKLNELGLRHEMVVKLAASLATSSHSLTFDHAKFICWVIAVRFMIQNEPNPTHIQQFVLQYPYHVENSLNSKERLFLQRFERAMHYLDGTDIPFEAERQLVFRICRFFEQGKLANINEVDDNRVSIYERYLSHRTYNVAKASQPLSPPSQREATRGQNPKPEAVPLINVHFQSQQRPEIIPFPHSNPESPQSLGQSKTTPQPSAQPPPDSRASITHSVSSVQFLAWNRMSSADIIDSYDVILDQLQTLPEIDAFASRIAQIMATNHKM